MVNRRPAPELVASRKFEIRRRYEHHAKVGKRTRSMAAIRISELLRWLGDAGLEPGEGSARVARIFVHHFVVLADGNRRAADWLNTYCPWIERRDREHMITQANHCPLKWSADKLAWKLGLTDAKRRELKITTIGAIDCSKEQRAQRRKRENAERQRALRAAKRLARVQHIG